MPDTAARNPDPSKPPSESHAQSGGTPPAQSDAGTLDSLELPPRLTSLASEATTKSDNGHPSSNGTLSKRKTNNSEHTPEEQRLLKEVQALAQRVSRLEAEAKEALGRIELERALRQREAEYGTETIGELRKEVQRQSERARNAERTLTRIDVDTITPLAERAADFDQLLPLLEVVERFVGSQLAAVHVKGKRASKSESMEQRVKGLSDGLSNIESTWVEVREKIKARNTRLDELQITSRGQGKKILALEQSVQASLEREGTIEERHQRELTSALSAEKATSKQLALANEKVMASEAEVARLATLCREMSEQLAKRDVAGAPRDSLLADNKTLRSESEALPERLAKLGKASPADKQKLDPVLTLQLNLGDFTQALQKLSSNPEDLELFFGDMVSTQDCAPLVVALSEALDSAESAFGEDESVLEDPKFIALGKTRDTLARGVAHAVEKRKSYSFLLAMDPESASPFANLLSSDALLELMGFAAVNSEWPHALATSKSLEVIDRLSPVTRAAVITLCEDDDLALLMLFGSRAIRAGVHEVKRMFGEAWGSNSAGNTPQAYERKLGIVEKHASTNSKIADARSALAAYESVPSFRKEALWKKFTINAGALGDASGLLGFDIRECLVLMGLVLD